ELGVRFKSDVNGTITGIRYYKGVYNTGPHVGHLWTSTGSLLASVQFSGETNTGWQTASFSSPVAITAGSVYIASYHTSTGYFASDQGYFSSQGVDSPPLHAFSNTNGGNGVFAKTASTASSAFPNQTLNATNYWVDVLFTPATATITSPAPQYYPNSFWDKPLA